MEDQLISFDVAVLAKEHGFNTQCINYWFKVKSNGNSRLTTGTEYDSDRDVEWDWNKNSESGIAAPYPNGEYKYQYSAPTQTTLHKWLREKHEIYLYLKPSNDAWDSWSIYIDDDYGRHLLTDYVVVRGWENALEEGLKLSFNYIK